MIKIIDTAVPASAPSIAIAAPDHAKVDETVKLVATADPNGVPALSYRWDFGDGTSENGRQVSHAYTKAGNYTAQLVAEGMDGLPARKTVPISVNGSLVIPPPAPYSPPE
jgi:PKD repeat protein